MSSAKALIKEVCDVIGEGGSGTDWKVTPTKHAKEFEIKEPSLADNLGKSRSRQLAEQYESLNAEAVAARDEFRATVRKANAAVFVTASLGAVLLVATGLQDLLGERTGRCVVIGIGLLGVITGGLATMWLFQAKEGRLAQKWCNSRARAEAKRLAYFKSIMTGAAPDPRNQMLALEYTRRFLLDNQIEFFRRRGGQHDRAAASALRWASQSVFVASTLTASAGILSVANTHYALIASLAVVASAFGALVAARSAVNLDRKNADQYRDTADKLEERKMDLDAYRERAAAGDGKAVQEFFEPIFVALEADLRNFLNDLDRRELAIGAMEKRLDAAAEVLKRRTATAARQAVEGPRQS